VNVPWLTLQLTGNSAWLPDDFGLCCLLVALACLAHVPKAWSSRSGMGTWSLPLTRLAAVVGLERLTGTKAYDIRDPLAISISGTTWAVVITAAPLTNGRFVFMTQSKNQALQLQRTLVPSD
jgi:hypothetical protein